MKTDIQEKLQKLFNDFMNLKGFDEFFSGVSKYFHFIEDTYPLKEMAHSIFSSHKRMHVINNIAGVYNEIIFSKISGVHSISPADSNELRTFHSLLVDLAQQRGFVEKITKPSLSIDSKSGMFRLRGKSFEKQVQPGTVRYIVLKVLIDNGGSDNLLYWKKILPKINKELRNNKKKKISRNYISTLVSEYKKMGIINPDESQIISIKRDKGISIKNPLF